MADLTPKQRAASRERVKEEVKVRKKVMKKKRDLFDEMTEGFDALADQRAGKRTLRTRAVKVKAAPSITARDLAKLRKQLGLS